MIPRKRSGQFLSETPQSFPDNLSRFGLTSLPAPEDRQIQELEQDLAARHNLLERLKARKARKEARLGQAGGLGPLALQEIQKQAQLVVNMQRSLLVERLRFEEEKRRQEDRRQNLELQESIERLQRQLQAKQGINTNSPSSIKDRLGPQKVSVFARIKKPETQMTENRGFKRKFPDSGHGQGQWRKPRRKKNFTNSSSKLPDELVLTNLTAQGPKKARARIDYHSLPEELVLTELTEEGPKPRALQIQEDDDRVVVEEDHLNR